MALCLSDRHLAAIRRHAGRAYPEECCGLLLGRREGEGGRSRVAAVLRARNLDANPRRGYFIDPRALLRGERTARRCGLRVLGYYHSHPDGAASPSARDRREAVPGASYLILAVREGEPQELRGFRCVDGSSSLAEEAIVILAEPPAP